MKVEQIDSIEEYIRRNLGDKSRVFVFSTDICAKTWADWAVVYGGEKAVAMERFLAWDNFKSAFVAAHDAGKKSIPSILRKFFVQDLISKNAALEDGNPQKLEKVISPDFAKSAYSFADWLTKILPSLNLWHKRLMENIGTYGKLDREDCDYQKIYDAYRAFLEKNNLFEPSWIEDVELKESEYKFSIMFPEQFEDILDIVPVLEKTESVTLCSMPESEPAPKVYVYPDSRSELRQTMLGLIDLCARQKKADWSEVALSVPSLEVYRPYIEREFSLYEIPFAIRAGISLTKNNAGKIFKEISACYKSDFSYASVRALVLDECIPWKKNTELEWVYSDDGKTVKKTVSVNLEQIRPLLIRQGNIMRCVCSYEEKDEGGNYRLKDVWITSLYSKYRSTALALEKSKAALENAGGEKKEALKKHIEVLAEELDVMEQLCAFYTTLKLSIQSFYKTSRGTAPGFNELLHVWFDYKSKFISEGNFSDSANMILSRCVVLLQEFAQIETEYVKLNEMNINCPFDFFISELDSKAYTPQTKEKGVNIFPYKSSACAFFKYQFVLDAGQKQIEVPYKRLTFLNATKRKKLGFEKDDKMVKASEVYAKLYAKNHSGSEDVVHFSCATDTFSGFSIPNSCLEECEGPLPNFDSDDYILEQKKWLLNSAATPVPQSFTNAQKKSLAVWKRVNGAEKTPFAVNSALKEKIEYSLVTGKNAVLKKALANYEADAKKSGAEISADVAGFFRMEGEAIKNVLENGKDFPKISARGEMEKFFPCQRKWVYSKLLAVTEESLDTSLLKKYDIGNLNHSILEKFMEQYVGKKLPVYDAERNAFFDGSEDVSEQVKGCFCGEENGIIENILRTSREEFAQSPIVRKLLLSQKERLRDNIIKFLKSFLLPYMSAENLGTKKDRGFGGCTVYGVELTCASLESGFSYFGKIDCLLKEPDYAAMGEGEGWIIVDYKSSKSSIPAKKECKCDEDGKLADFQMPMYLKLVHTESNCKKIAAAVYRSIKEPDEKRFVVDIYEKDGKADFENAFKPTMDVFECYAGLFAEKAFAQAENGEADFTPRKHESMADRQSVRPNANCINCSFKQICRTTYALAPNEIPV